MATKKKTKSSDRIHQMKISLKGAKPPIWRRVLVPGELTLGQLHDVIQAAMGWDGGHLHMFKVWGLEYGVPNPDWEMDVEDEDRVTLDRLQFKEKSRFLYLYDFGDDWAHDILVEKILPREDGKHYPICIKGSRACPPEDVGGVWGYASFLETIRDPKHPEHEDLLEWAGGEFDSEAFDLDAVNLRMDLFR
ncbi:MAG: plasmid pRiA4b ORF-3 family protein [Syntrophobacteraceae bacterium]|nr:plasmid pRiA4b ORF-3 family protein [Syntrophobacteraceae bacterium]